MSNDFNTTRVVQQKCGRPITHTSHKSKYFIHLGSNKTYHDMEKFNWLSSRGVVSEISRRVKGGNYNYEICLCTVLHHTDSTRLSYKLGIVASFSGSFHQVMQLSKQFQLAYDVHKCRMIPQLVIILKGEMCTSGNIVTNSRVTPSLRKIVSLTILYLQHKHYALWEVIEFGDSYKAPPEETAKDKGLAGNVSLLTKKKGRTVAITGEDMQKRKNDVKARTTLLFALPDEHQTLIEAARTMLANAKLPITFWVEAVNTGCYVQNRVLVIKPHNKTPYELFNERSPAIGFLSPFGYHVMILNTLDHLGKFDAKRDEVVVAGTSSTNILGTREDVQQAVKEKESPLRFIALPNWFYEAQMTTSNETTKKDDSILENNAPQKEQEEVNGDKEVPESSGNSNPTASTKVSTNDSFELASSSRVKTEVPTVSTHVPTDSLSVPPITSSVPRIIYRGGSSFPEPLSLGNATSFENKLEDFFGDTFDAVSLNDVEADLNNMKTAIQFSPTPTLINHKDHPKIQIIEPKKIFDALKDPSWVEAMQQELLQFKIQNVWVLVDCPSGVRPIKTKWVLKNKKDERGIVIRNKARLVAQGHTQKEGIYYKEVFAPVARIEGIRLFLAYASYMGFTLDQMDVKSAFLYGTIDEEVYVMQPPGFKDPEFPHRVYKVEKAMYELH
nr:hypothetical protein [Tanacetum cinerariifolium]